MLREASADMYRGITSWPAGFPSHSLWPLREGEGGDSCSHFTVGFILPIWRSMPWLLPPSRPFAPFPSAGPA